MKKIVLLGATGSIGQSTFELVHKNPDKFQIVGASAHSRFTELEQKAEDFRIKNLFNTKVGYSLPEFQEFLKKCEPDIVLNAIVGFAGLQFSVEILSQGLPLALANKESLVTAGELLMDLSRKYKAPILPVDSEHSAIFQCLINQEIDPTPRDTLQIPIFKPYKKILLTCSGGPFFGSTAEEIDKVTKAQALKHPNWDMGAKITIDSATLANKSLEFFEAMHLFNATKEQIEIVIHRESVVHSMVEFPDSSVIAQISPPDMQLPIAYALHFPERLDYHLPSQSFRDLTLSFHEPDKNVFRTLQVMEYCAERMGNFSIVFNAVNEVAVEAFLHEKIRFTDIFDLLEKVVSETKTESVDNLEQIFAIDHQARVRAEERI